MAPPPNPENADLSSFLSKVVVEIPVKSIFGASSFFFSSILLVLPVIPPRPVVPNKFVELPLPNPLVAEGYYWFWLFYYVDGLLAVLKPAKFPKAPKPPAAGYVVYYVYVAPNRPEVELFPPGYPNIVGAFLLS